MLIVLIFMNLFIKNLAIDEMTELLCEAPIPNIIAARGYPCETHYVKTPDGYILSVHRIPHGKSMTASTKPPILIGHGLLASSSGFVLPERGLAYLLADAGYDVWNVNFRGNMYSSNHTSKNPYIDWTFWNFSWHEMGFYDIPACIDYILNDVYKNTYPSLHYVGHSQGTTCYMVMASLRPEYNSKVKTATLMAPACIMKNSKLFLISLLKYLNIPIQLLGTLGDFQLAPNGGIVQDTVFELICTVSPDLCLELIYAFFGKYPENFDRSLVIPCLCHFPAGTSARCYRHFLQIANSGIFALYQTPLQVALLLTPIPYPVFNVRNKINIYYSSGDIIVDPKDVEAFIPKLVNAKEVRKNLLPDPRFTHIDFVQGLNAKKLIYDDLITYLDSNNQ